MADYSGLIAPGLQLIGSGMASNQYNNANRLNQFYGQQQFQLGQAERQRRDLMMRMLMPNIAQGLGWSPSQTQSYSASLPSGNPQDPNYGPNAFGKPPDVTGGGGSTAAQLGGLGMTGLGIASKAGLLGGGAAAGAGAASGGIGAGLGAAGAQMSGTVGGLASGAPATGLTGTLGLGGGSGLLGLGAATIPVIGGLVGAGLLAKHFIGQGRKAANTEVQSVENPFGQGVLPQVLQTAKTNPQLAKQQFIQGYNAYLQGENAGIQKGGNAAKVSQQSLTKNPALAQTATSIAQQVGIPNFQFGQPLPQAAYGVA